MQKIKITIHRDGTQSLEVIDGQGDDCLALTRDLEKRLGTPVGERKLRPEAEAARQGTSESIRESS